MSDSEQSKRSEAAGVSVGAACLDPTSNVSGRWPGRPAWLRWSLGFSSRAPCLRWERTRLRAGEVIVPTTAWLDISR